MSHAKNIGREQAKHAWDWVSQAKQRLNAKQLERYGTLARKLSSYLQVSGLGQTMAFLHANRKAKKDEGAKAEALLLEQIGQYLAGHERSRQRETMVLILEFDADEYRAATREAMAMADWLKRFAQGELGEEQG